MLAAVVETAYAAVRASSGGLVWRDGAWRPHGDPMEVALHVLALRIQGPGRLGIAAHAETDLGAVPGRNAVTPATRDE